MDSFLVIALSYLFFSLDPVFEWLHSYLRPGPIDQGKLLGRIQGRTKYDLERQLQELFLARAIFMQQPNTQQRCTEQQFGHLKRVVETKWPQIESIYLEPEELDWKPQRVCLVVTKSMTSEQTADVESYCRCQFNLAVKLITPEQFLVRNARSSLLFYYGQLFPGFQELHFALVQLVETNKPPGAAKLTRYEWALLLAGYLFGLAKSSEEGPNSMQAGNLRLLIGFLRSFSAQSSVSLVGHFEGRPGELELCQRPLTPSQAEVEPASKLAIYDPITSDKRLLALGRLGSALTLQLAEQPIERADMDEVGPFLSQLANRLETAVQLSGLLFVHGHGTVAPGCGYWPSHKTGTGSRSGSGRNSAKFAQKQQQGPNPATGRPPWRSSLKWACALLTDLFWVAAFLWLRNLALNYLQDWQADLEQRASSEMAHLRRPFLFRPQQQQSQPQPTMAPLYGSSHSNSNYNNNERMPAFEKLAERLMQHLLGQEESLADFHLGDQQLAHMMSALAELADEIDDDELDDDEHDFYYS